MKQAMAFLIITTLTGATLAQDSATSPSPVVVDPDFGLALDTPEGFAAEMIGQTDDGYVMIAVSETPPNLTPFDGESLCEITFSYDPAFGQGDQAWVNSLVDGTGFYDAMAQEVIIPGTVEHHEDFTHNGASSHRFVGRHDAGGSFLVSAIPTPMGFALVTCASTEPDQTWEQVQPMIDAIVVPGQPRDRLVPDSTCSADATTLPAMLERIEPDAIDKATILALDAERQRFLDLCGPLHADDIMDTGLADAGFSGTYRDFRYAAISTLGADLLTDEQNAALAEARSQVEATADTGTGERYMRYMHFIVGLRSLD